MMQAGKARNFFVVNMCSKDAALADFLVVK
jgi:hypothetical protein